MAPGHRALLTCVVISAVDFNLTWHRSEQDAQLADPSRIRILANLSLELRSVRPADAGHYTCVVSSEGGTAVASVFLTVQGMCLPMGPGSRRHETT